VRSRGFLEQRRVAALIQQATRAALALKDSLPANRALSYELSLTSARIRSVSQAVLNDPAQRAPDAAMADDGGSEIGLDQVAEMLRESEIDLRTLRDNVRAALAESSQVSIVDLLERFPAPQGLGSVIGYIALGVDHGEVLADSVRVSWQGVDQSERAARVPAVWFVRERLGELEA
jgi:hypothetical protein